MVMLSELRRHALVDARGERARLLDLAVDLSTGDYPLVTRVIFAARRNQPMQLPWEAVDGLDWGRHRLRLRDLSAARGAPAEQNGEAAVPGLIHQIPGSRR